MNWTTDKPKTIGWYWYREQYRQPGLMQLTMLDINGDPVYLDYDVYRTVNDWEGEWAGALEPPQ